MRGWRLGGARSAPAQPDGALAAQPDSEMQVPIAATGCFAPSMQLHFKPTGDVLVCCWNEIPLGNVRNASLSEIWEGAERRNLIDRLAAGDFGLGCEGCATQIAREGRPGSHPAYFDDWEQALGAAGAPPPVRWPSRIEFELSNSCNLQCIQCSGEYSSAIRLHREHRPPLESPYDDRFHAELAPFLTHIVDASFAGGEPFLGKENFRVWDVLAEVNPSAKVTIITNGTQWSRRIEQVLEQLTPDIIVSLDGATAATYEAIRGTSFEATITNFDRFAEHARRSGASLSVNFCWMPQNRHELIDILQLAEDRGAFVNVIVVRGPTMSSIPLLPAGELAEISARLSERMKSELPGLHLNGATLVRQQHLLQAWIGAAEAGESARERPTILQFRRNGVGPTDPAATEVAWRGEGHDVWRMPIDSFDRITDCPSGLATLLGVARNTLVGEHIGVLVNHLDRYDQISADDDSADFWLQFIGGDRGLGRIIPVRDATGRADSAVMIIAREHSAGRSD